MAVRSARASPLPTVSKRLVFWQRQSALALTAISPHRDSEIAISEITEPRIRENQRE
jgi:hypothetical protein